jgi:hypothetical protein
VIIYLAMESLDDVKGTLKKEHCQEVVQEIIKSRFCSCNQTKQTLVGSVSLPLP